MYCACQEKQSLSLKGATRTVFKANDSTNFEFVYAESTNKKSTRTKIRSHVMKRVKDTQALEQADSSREQQITQGLVQSALSFQWALPDGNPVLNSTSLCKDCDTICTTRFCLLLSPQWIVAIRITNLSTLGLPINCIEESTLLFEYLGNVYSYILNFSWQRGQGVIVNCLPYMISGPAVLNSVLSVMAANRMLMGGLSPHLITVYYHHKIEAIRIISKALKDATYPARVSDDALTAIAVLSVLENSSGFIEVGRRHLDAFDRLINERSDSSQSTPNVFQTGLIKLARFAGSNFPLVPRAIEEVPMSDLLSQIPQGAHFTLTAMFHELKCLSLDMTPSSETLPRAEWLERLNALGLSMHRMMAGELFKLGTDNKPLRAYAIIGNIFLCRYLRELPLSNTVFDYLLDCLSGALGEPDKERDLIWYPPRFLLWLFFVGGTAGEGRTWREWFRAQIPPVRAQLGLESWDDTLNILSMFPFVRGCYIPYQALWEESSHVSRASRCL